MSILYRAPNGTQFTDRDELDREYDIVASVADFDSYVEQFLGRSEQARQDLNCDLGVSYGPTRAETLDVFPGEPGGPVVVFVHGGYWMSLTSTEHSYVAPGLVAHGATVVVPTYALCPTVTIDEIVRQVRATIAWTYRNAAHYGADPSRMVVVGHSAGAHLVARLLETEWEEHYGIPSDVIAAACLISGLYDLRPFPFTKLQRDLQFTGEEILRNSPILNIPERTPPLLITNGAHQTNEFVRQSYDYYLACQSAGLDVEYVSQGEFNHFDETLQFCDADSELTQRLMGLIETKNEERKELS